MAFPLLVQLRAAIVEQRVTEAVDGAERAAQVVRQSANARWVGFLAVIVVGVVSAAVVAA